MNPYEKQVSSDPFDVLAGIQRNSASPPPWATPKPPRKVKMPKPELIKRDALKELVNADKWNEIGKLFRFGPRWTQFHGITFFDWTSCNAAFWEVFQPVAKGTLSSGRAHLKAIAENGKCKRVIANKPSQPRKPNLRQVRRSKLYEKQFGECYYCWHPIAVEDWTIDHIVAVSRGGTNKESNLVGACKSCNKYKGSLDVEIFEASNYLQRKREQVELAR